MLLKTIKVLYKKDKLSHYNINLLWTPHFLKSMKALLDGTEGSLIPLMAYRAVLPGDTPKGVLQVKESDMDSPSLFPGIPYDFLHCHIVLYAPIYTWQEGLLHSGINELVGEEEGGESSVEKEVEGLSDTPTEGNHPEVGGIAGVPLLVNHLDHRLPPKRREGCPVPAPW